jgi:hypothetical protein
MTAPEDPGGLLHSLLYCPCWPAATHFFCAFKSAMVPETLFCATAAALTTRRGRTVRQLAREAALCGLILN